jgi:fatty acid desaturase
MSAAPSADTARRADALSALVVVSHIVFTYAPVYCAAALGPGPVWIGLWLWFGLCQNGLINLMHECAHKLTFRRSWANEWLGGVVLAPLVLTDFSEYRERHWEHHRELGTARDPKLVYRTDIRGMKFARLALRCATGLEALKRLTERPPQEANESAGPKRAALSLRLVFTQGVFSGSLLLVAWATQGAFGAALYSAFAAYVLVYGYGTASVTVFAAAVRAIGEHQLGDEPGLTEHSAALRNLRCNAFTRLVLGAYGFGEHASHHRHPAVPYYRLPALSAELAQHDPAFVAQRGYIATIVSLVAPRAASSQQRPSSGS